MFHTDYQKLGDDILLCVSNLNLKVVDARVHPKLSESLTRIRKVSEILSRTEYTGILRDQIKKYVKPAKIHDNTIAALLHSCAKDRVTVNSEEEIVCFGDYGKGGKVPTRGCSIWTFNKQGGYEVFTYLKGKLAYFYPRNNDGKVYDEDKLQMSESGITKVIVMTERDGHFTKSGRPLKIRDLEPVGMRANSPNPTEDQFILALVVFFIILLLAVLRP